MKAVVVDEPGDETGMRLAEVDDPVPGEEEVLVRVHATALNRADLLQRMGRYPPPPGTSSILGLEMAGRVEAVGPAVSEFAPGVRVYGLPGGGGYAELLTIHQSLTMRIPERLDYIEAAAVPEAFFTAYEALVTQGRLSGGGRALVHGGGSGVGTAAVQIARALGAEVFATAGNEEKCRGLRELGAGVVINYRQEDFAEVIREHTKGSGVDVVLDVVGADYLERNLASLALRGRLVLVGTLGGSRTEVDLRHIMRKRLEVIGTVMRARSLEERAAVTGRYQERVEPLLVGGRLKPVIDRVFPLHEAAEAHRYMAANKNFGKIVLDVAGGCSVHL